MINKTTETRHRNYTETIKVQECSECGHKEVNGYRDIEQRTCLICGKVCCEYTLNNEVNYIQIDEKEFDSHYVEDIIFEEKKGYICDNCENSSKYKNYIKGQAKIIKEFNKAMKKI